MSENIPKWAMDAAREWFDFPLSDPLANRQVVEEQVKKVARVFARHAAASGGARMVALSDVLEFLEYGTGWIGNDFKYEVLNAVKERFAPSPAQTEERTCKWRTVAPSLYDSGCGGLFSTGSTAKYLADFRFTFCPFCGKTISQDSASSPAPERTCGECGHIGRPGYDSKNAPYCLQCGWKLP